MEAVENQLKVLAARLKEMEAEKEAYKMGQKASRVVVVPRDRGTKLAGRPSTDKDPEVLEWAEDMRRITKDLSDAEGAQLVLDHLTGAARDEIRLCPAAERANPSRIIERVLKTYTCHETPSTRWEDFYGRRQRGGESIQEFSLQLMRLLRRVEIASPDSPPLEEKNSILSEKFASGLADPALRREVRRFLQENPMIEFVDLRNKVLSWESPPPPPVAEARAARAKSAEKDDVQKQLDMHTAQLKATQEALEKLCQQVSLLTQRPAMPERRTGTVCYSCGKVGHLARMCRSGGHHRSSGTRHTPAPPLMLSLIHI